MNKDTLSCFKQFPLTFTVGIEYVPTYQLKLLSVVDGVVIPSFDI